MKNRVTTMPPLRFLAFIFLFGLMASCANQPKLPTPEEAKTVVWTKITAAAEKWSQGDPLGYWKCAAQDIVWIDELGAQKPLQGAEPLKAYLESFNGQVPHHEFKLIEPIFQVYDDIVIVTYRYLGIFNGDPGTPWKVTSVYRYIDGDWWSEHENWTEVKEPMSLALQTHS